MDEACDWNWTKSEKPNQETTGRHFSVSMFQRKHSLDRHLQTLSHMSAGALVHMEADMIHMKHTEAFSVTETSEQI